MVAKTKLTAEEQALGRRLLAYRKDPVGFEHEVLGVPRERIWPKMVQVAEGLRDHQFVAVPAGHSVSKTYQMGRLIVWFKTCFQPSTVITTAPSDNQVKNQLWREVHGSFQGSRLPLGGKMTSLMWNQPISEARLKKMTPEEREWWSKNFAIGFSTSPDTVSEYATKIAGWHNKWVLIVVDEACGIASQIWNTAIEGLVTNSRVKMVAIGNGTDPESEFAEACRLDGRLDHLYDEGMEGSHEPYMSDMGWWVIPISVRDTPNYRENREVIPGLADQSYERLICKRHPVGSNGWLIRIQGAFPSYKEGTYYGHELMTARKNKHIGSFPWDPTYPVYRFADFGDRHTAAIDIQFIRERVRVINDYWDNEGQGAPAMCASMQAMRYTWGKEHFAGPDMDPLTGSNAKQFSTGRIVRDTLRGRGFNFRAVDKISFNDGIQAARDLWPLVDIDESGAPTLLKAAKGYGKAKDLRHSTPDEPAFHNEPANTWHKHMMDAWRHCAIAIARMNIEGLGYVGRHEVVAQYIQLQEGSAPKDWDPMDYV